MSLYQEEVLKARKKFLNFNKSQEKELLNLYKELADQLSNEILDCRTSSQDAYLKKLYEIVELNINQLNLKLNNMIKDNIETSSQIAGTIQNIYYQSITDDSALLAMFKSMAINNSRKTVNKLIQGNYYKDGKTLDNRLWNITQKNKNDINILIKANVLRGANARELAKQLNRYVNPTKALQAHALADGMNPKIAYQAQRLARTSITHSFAETTIENAKTNPFNKGIKWNLSASHDIRMHGKKDICDEYSGRVFKPNSVPIQHPNCLCYFTEENVDIDEAIKELKAWSNGENNSKLDKLFKYNEGYKVSNNKVSDVNIYNNVKSIKELETVTLNRLSKYGVKEVDLTNLDLKLCKENIQQLESLMSEYGNNITAIKVGNTGREIAKVWKLKGNKENVLFLNKAFYKSYDGMVEKIKKQVEIGFLTDVGENYNIASITHEFGHNLLTVDRSDLDKEVKEIKKIYNSYKKEIKAIDKKEIVDKSINWEEAKRLKNEIIVSDYASEHIDEWIAESFANGILSKEPKKYSIKLIEIFNKYFKKK